MDLFGVTITLPTKTIFAGEASSLIVPAERGYLGVLAHHAPILAHLKPGTITLHDSSGKVLNFTLKSAGFLEVSGNKATLILDSLELPS